MSRRARLGTLETKYSACYPSVWPILRDKLPTGIWKTQWRGKFRDLYGLRCDELRASAIDEFGPPSSMRSGVKDSASHQEVVLQGSALRHVFPPNQRPG